MANLVVNYKEVKVVTGLTIGEAYERATSLRRKGVDATVVNGNGKVEWVVYTVERCECGDCYKSMTAGPDSFMETDCGIRTAQDFISKYSQLVAENPRDFEATCFECLGKVEHIAYEIPV